MNLSFYTVDSAFCDYLRRFDRHVPYTMDKKSTRPFIGILLTVHNYTYYAPLSSPKPKHLKMKNHIDFIKINNGTWGAINLNNMIPILKQFVEKVDPNNLNRSYDDVAYKNLLNNQLSWCNSHKDNILSKAQKLYNTITHETAHDNLRERCCDFIKLEAVLEHYHDRFINHEDLKADKQSRTSPFSCNMIKNNAQKINKKQSDLPQQHKKKQNDIEK